MNQEAETKAVESPEEHATHAVVDDLTKNEPKIMKPTCPGCGADPIGIKRLRYDFPDGVVIETFFCDNPDCRICINSHIVGFQQVKIPK